jgi:Ca2+-binding EF-hand superfamily protein
VTVPKTLAGASARAHFFTASPESGTLAPPPLQPPLDVPETGSEAQGSPAAPTTALGTAAAGSLAAPMKAFIDAFESEEGKAELRKLFHSIDTDGSGVVSSKEWGKAIGQHWKLMGRFFGGLTVGEVGQMFKKLDADGSGDLTWGEFETALQQMDWSVRLAQALESQQGAAELKALWDRLDKNGDGTVSLSELVFIARDTQSEEGVLLHKLLLCPRQPPSHHAARVRQPAPAPGPARPAGARGAAAAGGLRARGLPRGQQPARLCAAAQRRPRRGAGGRRGNCGCTEKGSYR